MSPQHFQMLCQKKGHWTSWNLLVALLQLCQMSDMSGILLPARCAAWLALPDQPEIQPESKMKRRAENCVRPALLRIFSQLLSLTHTHMETQVDLCSRHPGGGDSAATIAAIAAHMMWNKTGRTSAAWVRAPACFVARGGLPARRSRAQPLAVSAKPSGKALFLPNMDDRARKSQTDGLDVADQPSSAVCRIFCSPLPTLPSVRDSILTGFNAVKHVTRTARHILAPWFSLFVRKIFLRLYI